MKPFVVTHRARQDLLAIWQHIAEDRGVDTANRVISAFHDAIQKLAEYPNLGHTRADVKNPRYRFWNVHRFVIAYRTDRMPLTVARVLHGARDFKKLFK